MSLGTRAVYNKQWRPPLQPMAVKIESIINSYEHANYGRVRCARCMRLVFIRRAFATNKNKNSRIADGAVEAELCKLFSASLSRAVAVH
jgi:hypothetical protein